GNLPALGSRRGHERAQVAVACKVAGAADAVHDVRAHHMGGVHVAVDVGLDHAIEGDAAQAADQLGVVGNFLGAQQDSAAVEVHVAVEFLNACLGQGEGGGGGEVDGAVLDQVQHAVLDDLGVGLQPAVPAARQPGQHSVGNVAH